MAIHEIRSANVLIREFRHGVEQPSQPPRFSADESEVTYSILALTNRRKALTSLKIVLGKTTYSFLIGPLGKYRSGFALACSNKARCDFSGNFIPNPAGVKDIQIFPFA